MTDNQNLSLDESLDHDVSVGQGEKSYIDHNAELNLFSPEGQIQFEEDKKAARQYFLTHVNPNTVYFHNIEEKLEYLVEHGYYEKEILDKYIDSDEENQYCSEFIKELFKHVYNYKYRFDTFMGALKFYSSYSMKTNDGKRYLERYEDRIVMVALTLAEGDKDKAVKIADEIIAGKLQPATPTFLNAGKKQRGEYVSCFPAGTPVMTDDGYKNIEDITIKDKVLSHDGLFHEVEEKIVNANSERLIRIKHYGNKEDLLLTPNHPVLVWTNRDIVSLIDGDGADINKGFVWLEAQDVTEEDFIVGANVKENKEEKEYSLLEFFDYDKNNLIEIDGIIKKKNIDRKTRKKFEFSQSFNEIRNNVAKDYDLGLLFGWYISEGHVSKRRTKDNINKPNGVHFTLGTHEINFIEELTETIEKVFNIKPVVYPSKFDGSTKISINSPIIGNLFNKILGTGFNKKVIPNDFIISNREFQLGLIHGVFRGDGHTTSGACSLDLVNPNIISTLQLIMTRLGIITRIRTYINSSGNLTGQLTIPGLPGNNEEIIYSIKKNLNNYIGLKGTGNNFRNSEFYKIEDNKIVYQVKNVEITDDIPDTVYNLEVKDAHTYTVNNVIVHNCFLLRTEDSMESIANTITSSLQLSKRGGGVGILLTNIREQGSTIKNIEGASSGVIPVMKLLEDSFTYANQLGARQGAGAVYISACHPDVLSVLDTKRENADEKVRIKTLSIGLVIPDIAFEMARKNENLYLFSPKDVYDVYGVPMSDISITEKYHEMVEDPRISKKKISARHLFQTIAELQFESGYPYLMFEDTANQWNNIDGRINMSNLCSEILQINTPAEFDERGNVKEDAEGRDISCNLASLNIANVMKKGDFKDTVHTAIHSLTTVSDNTNISIVPNVRNGNEKSHSIGLGTMNLHGFLGSEKIHYGSDEALDFTNVFYATLRYHSLQASMELAKDKGTFYDFNKSDYVKTNDQGYSKALENYTNGTWETFPHTQRIKEMYQEYDQWYPQQEDWQKLDKEIQEHGLYHAYLNANAPTGNISYVNNSTSSLHPIVAKIEARKQSGLGRVYYPAYGLTNDNLEYYDDAYEIGYKAIIDTYAVAGKHVDQGQSLTLFFKNTDTTRTLNKAYNYAWSRGKEKNEYGEVALYDPRTSWKTGIVKTLYYSRIRSDSIEGTELEGCVSCTI